MKVKAAYLKNLPAKMPPSACCAGQSRRLEQKHSYAVLIIPGSLTQEAACASCAWIFHPYKAIYYIFELIEFMCEIILTSLTPCELKSMAAPPAHVVDDSICANIYKCMKTFHEKGKLKKH